MTTTVIPHACHGVVIFLVTMSDKEVRNISVSGTDGAYQGGYYYYIDGISSYIVKETGQRLTNRAAGWLSLEHTDSEDKSHKAGTVIATALGETTWVCIPKLNNSNRFPSSLSCINAAIGEINILPNGTNAFLAKGKLEINSKVFTGPTQLRIRSGDASYISLTDTYLLIFPS